MDIITVKFNRDMMFDAFAPTTPLLQVLYKTIAVLDGDKICGKRDDVIRWYTAMCLQHNTTYNCEIKSLQDDGNALSQAEAMYQYTEGTAFQKIYEDLGLVEV
jgi:hypothetical protein